MKHAKLSEILLVCSDNLRLSANQNCWAAQLEIEQKSTAEINKYGWLVWSAHAYNSNKKNSLINSQRNGIGNFRNIDPKLVQFYGDEKMIKNRN
ncbi:hypothetical protein [Pedobacter aquatilis]|uniref:hypothetical protein n=1 Tax=Pedobacter aquatilis TaxID=351343 RepID=UPI00292F7BC9|nr:hypothetical protein [Pedobacter aquatilis]